MYNAKYKNENGFWAKNVQGEKTFKGSDYYLFFSFQFYHLNPNPSGCVYFHKFQKLGIRIQKTAIFYLLHLF